MLKGGLMTGLERLRRRPVKWLSLGALLFLVSAAGPILVDDAVELESVIRELRELRRSYYSDRDARAAEINAVNDVVVVFRQDVDKLRRERDSAVEDIEAVKTEIDALRSESEILFAEREQVLGRIRQFASFARKHVSDGIPYRASDRLLAVELFEQSESPRDAFARMWTFCEEELRAARSGETYTDEIELAGGRRKHARFGRVGLQVLGFVTEDGQDVGIWDPLTGWSEEAGAQEAESIRTTIEILDRRRGPAHVALPARFGSDAGK